MVVKICVKPIILGIVVTCKMITNTVINYTYINNIIFYTIIIGFYNILLEKYKIIYFLMV